MADADLKAGFKHDGAKPSLFMAGSRELGDSNVSDTSTMTPRCYEGPHRATYRVTDQSIRTKSCRLSKAYEVGASRIVLGIKQGKGSSYTEYWKRGV